MVIIGVTGSIGSGKTKVSNLFRKYGFKVINVDKFYTRIYKENKSLRNKIKNEFGTANRAKLKKIVFKNPSKLKKLNKLTHPIIINEVKKSINKIKKQNKNPKIIIDAPLLIEAKTTNLVDKIIVIKCDKKIQLKRVLKKKKYTKREINNIIKSQMPLNEKLKYADFIVDNSSLLIKTKKQVEEIIKKI